MYLYLLSAGDVLQFLLDTKFLLDFKMNFRVVGLKWWENIDPGYLLIIYHN